MQWGVEERGYVQWGVGKKGCVQWGGGERVCAVGSIGEGGVGLVKHISPNEMTAASAVLIGYLPLVSSRLFQFHLFH